MTTLPWVGLIAAAMVALTPPAIQPPDEGVLIGYEGLGDPPLPDQTRPYAYRTMWITFSGSGARIEATVPDLIVPRPSGFWRLGRTTVCEFQPSDPATPDQPGTDSTRDVLWQTPIATQPVVREGATCKTHAPGDRDDDGSTAVKFCDIVDGGYLVVSPEFVAEHFEIGETAACEPRGGRQTDQDRVHRYGSVSPVSIAEVLGSGVRSAYAAAARAGFIELSKQMNCPEPDPDNDYHLDRWSIGHDHGAWRPAAALNEEWGDCAYTQPIDRPLPRAVTGQTEGTVVWDAFASAVTNLDDLYPSPSQEHALVVAAAIPGATHLVAFAVANGRPAKVLADIPWPPDGSPNPRIVMAQWASGRGIVSWTKTLTAIRDHPLAPPRVVSR